MSYARSFVAVLAPLVALALAGSAAAQMGTAPVSISSCTVLRAAPLRPVTPAYWYPYYGRLPSRSIPVTDGLSIAYQNTAAQVADRVAFEVDYRGQRDKIVDVGKFSPNVTINHSFGNFEGLAYLGETPNSCRVVAVRFVDGHAWHRAAHGHPQAR